MISRLARLVCFVCALPAEAPAQHASDAAVTLRVVSHSALVRSSLGSLLPPERRVSQMGLEILIAAPWPALHAEARFLRSNLGSSDLRSIDAGLVVGWRSVGLAAAYGQRGSYDPETGLAHTRDAEFGRVGLRLRSGAARSHFDVHLRGDVYVPTQQVDAAADSPRGWDVEGGVTWRKPAQPLSASLGYRLERFRIFGVEQEVSALTVALGVAFGGR